MESLPTIILTFVVVIGVLVFIHEAGHFLVAKLFKVEVETFSLGFGPRLLGFRRGGTDYRISAIPLGGYVKMLGENPEDMEATRGQQGALMSKPAWQRFLIFVAGPGANILLAIVLPALVFMASYEISAHKLEPARVGFVALGSPAEKAGVQVGDLIVDFAGVENPTWAMVEDLTLLNPNQSVSLVVKRSAQLIPLTLELAQERLSGELIGVSGMLPELPGEGVGVSRVESGTPAARAGLQAGDVILQIEHQPIRNIFEELAVVGANVGRPLKFVVRRQGQLVELTITPYLDESRQRGVVGFVPEPYTPPVLSTRLGPLAAIREGIAFNLHQLRLMKAAFGAVFSGDRSVRDTFAGPVGIAVTAGEAAQQGLKPLLMLMALLSLSLGVFNLFPVPILDGGQVLMLALEKGFHWFGGELSVALREKIQTIGFTLIILLMGYIIYADIAKLMQ